MIEMPIPVIDLQELERDIDCKWRYDPTKYPYVRKQNYFCCTHNYIPLKKKSCFYIKGNIKKQVELRLIGWTFPKSAGYRLFSGSFFYLKGYDKGMVHGYLVYDNPELKKVYGEDYHPTEAVRIVGRYP